MDSNPGISEWLRTDETANEMLSRFITERPPLLLPPLQRLPLRPPNVVEITGPSPSAKTQILMQVALNCILPNNWNGVYYGGLDRPVVFIDLDCGFHISRLLQLINHRIFQAKGRTMPTCAKDTESDGLIQTCLSRFLYMRCHNTTEFLSTLKTLHHQFRRAKNQLGLGVYCLMIDSIGAYYWLDRASILFPLGANNRKKISLQSVAEIIVCELQKFLLAQPVLILATKATIFGDKFAANTAERSFENLSYQDTVGQSLSHREYMPPVWQSFITHRIFVQPLNLELSTGPLNSEQVYIAEWLLPLLHGRDKFVVRDVSLVLCSQLVHTCSQDGSNILGVNDPTYSSLMNTVC